MLLSELCLVEDFFVLLEGLFGGFAEVKADFFCSVNVLIGLSFDASVCGLLFLRASPQLVVKIHHFLTIIYYDG